MTYKFHSGTCAGWASGDIDDCDCIAAHGPAWRIRKEPEEQFPWRVFRLTADATYEPLMRCSSFDRAMALIDGFAWLKRNGVDTNV